MKTNKTTTPGSVLLEKVKDNDLIKPVQNINSETNISAEYIKTNVEKYLHPSQPILHNEILNKLLNQIQPINFLLLIRPEAKMLINELSEITLTYEDRSQKLQKKLNAPKDKEETSRARELEEILNKMEKGIKVRHYVVCIITELLKVAEENRWNLCHCYDYVYIYNGAFWKQLSKDDLKYFLGNVAVKFGYPEIDAVHHLFKEELLKQFLTQAHLPAPNPDTDKVYINLQNGTFEFVGNKWQLRQFNPKDFLTYQLPFVYNPNATCPMFDCYLQKVLPDIDCRKILQEFSGFIFTKMNLEKMLVLTGGGSNGKSVFFNVLTALVGNENTLTYPMGMFNHEYKRARLTNVLLNYSSEKGTDLDVDIFKALVSGEPQQAREPHGKSFTIRNKVRFIMNCNELPRQTESTEAYYRRFLIIHFNVLISELDRDIDLAEKIIKQELPGVFNWLLKGLDRLLQQKEFTKSEAVNKAIAEFKKQADNVALFIEEFGYKTSNSEKFPLAELYSKYKMFCMDDGYKPLGKNKFSSKIESKGFESTRLNNGSKGFFICA